MMQQAQMAHPLFGGSLGDAARRGQGVGLAPLSEGDTAFVPNPYWPGMTAVQQTAFGHPLAANPLPPAPQPRPLSFNPIPPAPQPRPFSNPGWPGMTAVQTTAFPGGALAPGEVAVQQRAFNPMIKGEDVVYAQLPNGQRVRAIKHRVYRTPRTRTLTARDTVLVNPNATYTLVWLPASWTGQRPQGAGKWIQLSRGAAHLGLLHTKGIKARPVTVLEVANAMEGPMALVRYQKSATNPTTRMARVSIPAMRSSPKTVQAKSRARVSGEGLWCKIFPNSSRCLAAKLKAKCPPGYENYPVDPTKCIPMGNPANGDVATRAQLSRERMAKRSQLARRNPKKKRAKTPLERARQMVRDLASGESRIVIDERGIAVRKR